ncbi:antitoxin HipB [mine drainage metagenome]|uniref:Antitoxin HipB n=1 Tax=mine drainage metagenome TaxID=410659 RepID=A0A1J5PSB2_9ZZZZ
MMALRGVLMGRPYKAVVDLSHLMADPDVKKFADGVRRQVQAEYQETFGLGDIVAKRRTELNLSQIQLAKSTGVSQADISRIECGKGNPTFDTLKKIFAALQLQMTLQAKTPNRFD